ncbi:MAG: histidine kinase [Actinomycetota bacterium]|nr:histidine kinase [Actinomycetota bacterium]
MKPQLKWLLAAALLVWGVWIAVAAPDVWTWLQTVGVGWSFAAAGFVAWTLKPQNRTGPLLVLIGIGFVFPSLEFSAREPLLFTVGSLIRFSEALFIYTVLAFPEGRLRSLPARILVAGAFTHSLILGVATFFYDPRDWGCADCPAGLNLLLTRSDPELITTLNRDIGLRIAIAVVLLTSVVLVWRLFKSSVPRRRVLLPVYLPALFNLPATAYVFLAAFRSFPEYQAVQRYIVMPTLLVMPAFFVVGLLRLRARRGRVGELIIELGRAPDMDRLEAALRNTLGDPSLRLGLWARDTKTFITPDGTPLDLVASESVTHVDDQEGPLAVIVHDLSLKDEPELLEAAASATQLALENQRLTERIKAQLAEVAASRARIVRASDEAGRRIERNLHDGAQQRLVGLALNLKFASSLAAAEGSTELVRLLDESGGDLDLALQELRDLAQGLHPAALEEGLDSALEELAERSPTPVTVDAPSERFAPELEAALYYTAAEALTNVAKHSRATRASVMVSRSGDFLRLEVIDDGVGGVDPGRGTGLTGLRDRVEAVGGTLEIENPPTGGTRIAAEVPCKSSLLTTQL